MAKSKEKPTSTKPSKKWEMIKEGRKHCPKCGKGVYMGHHKSPERFTCGKCGYTEHVTKNN